MSALLLALYFLALGLFLAAALKMTSRRVEFGWLGLAVWVSVPILRALGAA